MEAIIIIITIIIIVVIIIVSTITCWGYGKAVVREGTLGTGGHRLPYGL